MEQDEGEMKKAQLVDRARDIRRREREQNRRVAEHVAADVRELTAALSETTGSEQDGPESLQTADFESMTNADLVDFINGHGGRTSRRNVDDEARRARLVEDAVHLATAGRHHRVSDTCPTQQAQPAQAPAAGVSARVLHRGLAGAEPVREAVISLWQGVFRAICLDGQLMGTDMMADTALSVIFVTTRMFATSKKSSQRAWMRLSQLHEWLTGKSVALLTTGDAYGETQKTQLHVLEALQQPKSPSVAHAAGITAKKAVCDIVHVLLSDSVRIDDDDAWLEELITKTAANGMDWVTRARHENEEDHKTTLAVQQGDADLDEHDDFDEVIQAVVDADDDEFRKHEGDVDVDAFDNDGDANVDARAADDDGDDDDSEDDWVVVGVFEPLTWKERQLQTGQRVDNGDVDDADSREDARRGHADDGGLREAVESKLGDRLDDINMKVVALQMRRRQHSNGDETATPIANTPEVASSETAGEARRMVYVPRAQKQLLNVIFALCASAATSAATRLRHDDLLAQTEQAILQHAVQCFVHQRVFVHVESTQSSEGIADVDKRSVCNTLLQCEVGQVLENVKRHAMFPLTSRTRLAATIASTYTHTLQWMPTWPSLAPDGKREDIAAEAPTSEILNSARTLAVQAVRFGNEKAYFEGLDRRHPERATREPPGPLPRAWTSQQLRIPLANGDCDVVTRITTRSGMDGKHQAENGTAIVTEVPWTVGKRDNLDGDFTFTASGEAVTYKHIVKSITASGGLTRGISDSNWTKRRKRSGQGFELDRCPVTCEVYRRCRDAVTGSANERRQNALQYACLGCKAWAYCCRDASIQHVRNYNTLGRTCPDSTMMLPGDEAGTIVARTVPRTTYEMRLHRVVRDKRSPSVTMNFVPGSAALMMSAETATEGVWQQVRYLDVWLQYGLAPDGEHEEKSAECCAHSEPAERGRSLMVRISKARLGVKTLQEEDVPSERKKQWKAHDDACAEMHRKNCLAEPEARPETAAAAVPRRNEHRRELRNLAEELMKNSVVFREKVHLGTLCRIFAAHERAQDLTQAGGDRPDAAARSQPDLPKELVEDPTLTPTLRHMFKLAIRAVQGKRGQEANVSDIRQVAAVSDAKKPHHRSRRRQATRRDGSAALTGREVASDVSYASSFRYDTRDTWRLGEAELVRVLRTARRKYDHERAAAAKSTADGFFEGDPRANKELLERYWKVGLSNVPRTYISTGYMLAEKAEAELQEKIKAANLMFPRRGHVDPGTRDPFHERNQSRLTEHKLGLNVKALMRRFAHQEDAIKSAIDVIENDPTFVSPQEVDARSHDSPLARMQSRWARLKNDLCDLRERREHKKLVAEDVLARIHAANYDHLVLPPLGSSYDDIVSNNKPGRKLPKAAKNDMRDVRHARVLQKTTTLMARRGRVCDAQPEAGSTRACSGYGCGHKRNVGASKYYYCLNPECEYFCIVFDRDGHAIDNIHKIQTAYLVQVGVATGVLNKEQAGTVLPGIDSQPPA